MIARILPGWRRCGSRDWLGTRTRCRRARTVGGSLSRLSRLRALCGGLSCRFLCLPACVLFLGAACGLGGLLPLGFLLTDAICVFFRRQLLLAPQRFFLLALRCLLPCQRFGPTALFLFQRQAPCGVFPLLRF